MPWRASQREPIVSLLKHLRSIGPGLIILLVATAGIVGAEPFTFGDINGSEYYADAAYNLRDAGVTNGCHGGEDYCPSLDVSRGQMAAFLDRGLPGVTASANATPSIGVNDADGLITLRTIDVRMPGIDGVQYVQLSGQSNVFINGTQAGICSANPCSAQLYLTDDANNQLAVGVVRISADDHGAPIHIEAVVPIASQANSHRFHLKTDTTNVAGQAFYVYHFLQGTTIAMDAGG
jgi:hypothetical protein